MEQAIITEIQRFSLGDGPGIRTTVFFKGCNLRCPWCHNPETLRAEPEMPYGMHMSVNDVMAVIRRDAAYYKASGGGVTLSGGEPLLQAGFCRELAMTCRAEGFPVLLDTAGSAEAETLCGMLPYIDQCYIDLKAADADDYTQIVGGDFTLVCRNMELLAVSNVETVVRIPIIPGYNETREYAKRLADVVQMSGLRSVMLLPFHRLGSGKYTALSLPYAYKDTEPPEEESMRDIAAVFTDRNFETAIGG